MQLLAWEFLSKLEKLLPVPDLSQVGNDVTLQQLLLETHLGKHKQCHIFGLFVPALFISDFRYLKKVIM